MSLSDTVPSGVENSLKNSLEAIQFSAIPSSEFFRGIFVLVALLFSAVSGLSDDRIPMDGKVNGQTVHLAFDSGCGTGLLLWHPVADQLGLKITPVPVGITAGPGESVMGITEPVDFELLGKPFGRQRFNVVETRADIHWDVQGLVGWPAFKNETLVLKGAEGVLAVGAEMPPEAAGWLKLRLRPDVSILCVELPEGEHGAGASLLVDTGNPDAVLLSSQRWREWKKAHLHEPVTLCAYYTPSAHGLVVKEVSWAKELSLNGLVLHDVAVMEADGAASTPGGPDYAATLGLKALQRLDLVIDGKAGLAYMHSRTEPPEPYEYNRLGAVFVPQSEHSDDLVAYVATGSPAADAGIRDGDILLKINQLDATKWRTQPGILPLSQFWEQPAGTKLVLTLKRGDATTTTTVALKNILGP